jgi:hypothetical protein
MQVAAAERCRRDFEDCIGGFLDIWVRAVFDGDLAGYVRPNITAREKEISLKQQIALLIPCNRPSKQQLAWSLAA